MSRINNYQIQAAQAKARFLTYDQHALVEKFHLAADEQYIYVNLLCKPYRISRTTGDMEYREGDTWLSGNSHEEVMTMLDLLCDSREDRFLTGRWKNLQSFGMLFHQNLAEAADPFAALVDRETDCFCRACEALGGWAMPGADLAYGFEVFDGLPTCIQFWHGDEEFAPRLRYLWDENAHMYLRYETMYFARMLLLRRIREQMHPGA